MKLKFTKMQSLGNDFVVIDAVRQAVDMTPARARRLADRRRGIGCDQVLLAEAGIDGADFGFRIYNADGSEAGQCGNGARCLARFVHAAGLTDRAEIVVRTTARQLTLRVLDSGQVAVDMGVPEFEPAAIPFDAPARAGSYSLTVAGRPVEIVALSLGNPHAVQLVDNVAVAPVAELGPLLEQHPRFPARVNAGFLQVVDRGRGRLRVFERGTGETLACGSGACAAVVAGQVLGRFDARVELALPGGVLWIEWSGDGRPVRMTGPAVTVFEGQLELN